MGYDPSTCYQRLKSQGFQPCPSTSGVLAYKCTEYFSPTFHQYCAGKDPYSPFQLIEVYNASKCGPDEYNVEKCQEKTFGNVDELLQFLEENPDFKARPCYCCCACYAWQTPIAISEKETNEIQHLTVGDQILTANFKGGELSWKTHKLKFSGGTPPLPKNQAHYPLAVFIHFEEESSLICTPDQLFLLASGKLKAAGKLSIEDELVNQDGKAIPINSVKLAEYSGGWHHVATTLDFNGSVDGHLLCSNGVVTGDYTLQVHQEELGDMLEDGPSIGSDEYDQLHSDNNTGFKQFQHPDVNTDDIHTPSTLQHFDGEALFIPDDANKFVAKKQAQDIKDKATIRDFNNQTGVSSLKHIFMLCNSFYPDINYHCDWNAQDSNVYAYTLRNKQHLVVTGGFLRIEELKKEGLALAVSQAVASFLQPEGFKHEGLLDRIYCDYFGIGLVMQTIWEENAYNMAEKGYDQIRTIFDLISPENKKGNPLNPQKDPDISCRETTMTYARLGGDLPACATKEPVPMLKVTGDEVGSKKGKPTVEINFNLALDHVSAQQVDNYILDPVVAISKAEINDEDDSKVLLIGDFKHHQHYELTVRNVTGVKGEKLDPNNNKAYFKTHLVF